MLAWPHLLPSAGTGPGHCLFPGAGQPPVGASPSLPCLQFKGKERFGAERTHSLLVSMSLLGRQPGGDAVGRTPTPLSLGVGNIGSPWQISEDAGGPCSAGACLLLAHLCSLGSSPLCRPLRRPGRGNPECPERSSAWRKPGETRGDVREKGPAGGGRGSAAASPYPGAGPPRSRLYTWRGLSR